MAEVKFLVVFFFTFLILNFFLFLIFLFFFILLLYRNILTKHFLKAVAVLYQTAKCIFRMEANIIKFVGDLFMFISAENVYKPLTYLSTLTSWSSRSEAMNIGESWSAFSLWVAHSKYTGLRYKWNPLKPISSANSLYSLNRKRMYIFEITAYTGHKKTHLLPVIYWVSHTAKINTVV